MKALRLHQVGELRLDEVTLPEPSPEETVVRVRYCALCRTDAKMWQKGQRDLVLPRVLGHEVSGIDLTSGREVVVWPGATCGSCSFCIQGSENLCPDIHIMGFNRDGGLAQAMVVPKESLIPVPAGVSLRLACLAEPLACCLNALHQIQTRPGDRILVFGAGPVGLLMGLAARSFSARAFVVEKEPARLEQSQVYLDRLGIPAGTQPSAKGFDAAINVCAATDTLFSGLRSTRAGGSFCLFSGLPHEDTITSDVVNEIHYRQLRVTGAYGCTRAQFHEALDIIRQHDRDIELLVEGEITLEEVTGHLPRIADGQALKILVRIE
ncbi:alcohol dehydrogenase catalytic domain-containing protein [Desulfomonile tiedjei]|uniref:Zn-dependent alcohol dehydrogenase n=1 Tax=Desulfomonile tiedjei (strain ATCC 49306 / DSM 6799 / DCB-1) TaxID=706587 RepID=I4C2B6_DESTA|nr:alcohol dehydrogenase catalytic domain-containing protein [Desulfomonile tiedjei]AFM23707.1 Zn-dependent alcohol dehydrogenase [Desulfomonile tiedjei DSM 6799]